MRLINTNTLMFEEFIGSNIPAYAILSHTWGSEEVTFQAMDDPSSRRLKSYKKIEMTCRLAKAAGYYYAWIDTCCIDQKSSAELTEAINSMFRWYRRAAICYVYLEDLSAEKPWADFQQCRWLTRGWTLQELVAPAELFFFDREWNFRIKKTDSIDIISRLTGVPRNILLHGVALSSISVAEKMCWASRRRTTRVEDMAYCLLGIFNINMPLLYGEEERAFIRLQQEIIRNHADLSLFAWRIPQTEFQYAGVSTLYSGLLAQSPAWFNDVRKLVSSPHVDMTVFQIENGLIKLDARVILEKHPGRRGTMCILPVCSTSGSELIGITLKKCGPDMFVRSNPQDFAIVNKSHWITNWPHVKRHLIQQLPEIGLGNPAPPILGSDFILSRRRHMLDFMLPKEITIKEDSVWPSSVWESEDLVFFLGEDPTTDGAVAKLSILGSFTGSVSESLFHKDIECYVYIIRWGQVPRRPQIVLHDPLRASQSLRQFNDALMSYDYRNSFPLRQALQFHGGPRKSCIAYDLEDMEESILISCATHKVDDSTLRLNPFWRIEFSWRIVPNSKVLGIVEKQST